MSTLVILSRMYICTINIRVLLVSFGGFTRFLHLQLVPPGHSSQHHGVALGAPSQQIAELEVVDLQK